MMQKLIWAGLISLFALTGCARHYVMRLNNGSEITTATKPRLNDGNYAFKDASGEEHFVSAGRVRAITPASMAERESKPQTMKGGPPKKRKWYLLWLG